MRFGFWIKVALVAVLVVVVDQVFGVTLGMGLFAAGWLVALVAGRQDVRRSRIAWAALAAAALCTAALFDEPGPLPWLLFWIALSIAALVPRAARFDDAWRWSVRLALHGLAGLAKPVTDLRLLATRRPPGTGDVRALAATLALPLTGGALFIALFAQANPLIGQAFADIRLPPLWRILLWTAIAAGTWPAFRPSALVMRLTQALPDPEPRLPGMSLPSVLIALGLFNAIFAVQNALDIAYLWSGGALPGGLSHAEYAHRGAYPLIATALLAGLMALAMLRPGSAGRRDPVARTLVILWVAQNLVLVASSVLRTIDYVEASMLTGWRIAALLWMALVAFGLVTIGWRIAANRSARWLVNVNAAAAALVLAACCFVDLGAMAARWNVRAADPRRIDLCYLSRVGEGALVPVAGLERRRMDPATRDRVRYVRSQMLASLERRQRDWTDWTPRGARRLADARAILGANPPAPATLPKDAWRDCGGTINYPPPPPPPSPAVSASPAPVPPASGSPR